MKFGHGLGSHFSTVDRFQIFKISLLRPILRWGQVLQAECRLGAGRSLCTPIFFHFCLGGGGVKWGYKRPLLVQSLGPYSHTRCRGYNNLVTGRSRSLGYYPNSYMHARGNVNNIDINILYSIILQCKKDNYIRYCDARW